MNIKDLGDMPSYNKDNQNNGGFTFSFEGVPSASLYEVLILCGELESSIVALVVLLEQLCFGILVWVWFETWFCF